MVFSGKKGDYTENEKTDPPNYYGKTKVEAEEAVLKYKKSLVLRVNPIGKRPSGAHPSFMQWFFDTASNNRSFNLFTDVVINPISTKTLSNMIIDIITDFKPGILHLGSRNRVNKAEIWEEVLKLFPNYSGKITRLNVNKTQAGKVAFRPREMWLNIDKAIKLGYSLPYWKDEVGTVLGEIINKGA
jgi:dTDP-4-dehydrorhamnose reductase